VLNVNNRTRNIAEIFNDTAFVFSRNESQKVFEKLVSGHKIVVAGYNSEMDEILTVLRSGYPRVRFFRGKENLWSHNKNWLFPKISYSQPRAELVQLMASGIYQFWRYWLRDRTPMEFKLTYEDTVMPEPLSLNSNVAFVFVILILGVGMGLCGFLAEMVYHGFSRVRLIDRRVVCRKRFWSKYFRAVSQTSKNN